MKTISDILKQRMSESEVELMKAENAELKQILASFGKNYNKFEDLITNTIRANKDEQLKLMSELHNRQEQKLTALRTSNEIVSAKITNAVGSMKDNITRDITSVYEKMNKETAQSMKNYNESIKSLERQTKRIWAITGVKEALFWSVCLVIVVIMGRATLDLYGVSAPIEVWQILYPSTFVPFILYVVREIIKKIKEG
jgi:phage regulator Rha-like protein